MNLIALFSLIASKAFAQEQPPKNIDVSVNAGIGFSCFITCGQIAWALRDDVKLGITGSILPVPESVFYIGGDVFLSSSVYGQFHIFGDSGIASRFFVSSQLGVYADNFSGLQFLPYLGANIGYEQPIGERFFLYTHLGGSVLLDLLPVYVEAVLPDVQLGLGKRF
jgi:hypothetical protein